MKNKFLLSIILMLFSVAAFSQTIDVTFEGVEKGTTDAVQMDSVYVENINRDTSTTLYHPNFSLTLCNDDPVSAEPIGFDYNAQGIKSVYPNPFNDYANIVINNSESKQVRLSIYNLTGSLVASYENYLVKGEHQFQVSTQNPGMYMLFLNDDKNSSYKIMSQAQGKSTNAVRYIGVEGTSSSSEDKALVLKSAVADNCFTHFQGDTLMVEGYADCYSNVIQYYKPTTTEAIVLEFELADDIDPTLETSDITVYLDANGGVSVSVSDLVARAIDNCGLADTTLSASNFDCSQTGTQSVDVTLTDRAGNSTTLSAQVTVSDTISPMLATQAASVELDENGEAVITVADVVGAISDNCSLADTTLSQSEFSCADLGVKTIEVTVTDSSDNSTMATAEVTVVDNIDPALTTKVVTVELDENGAAAITAADVVESASDNCSLADTTLSQSEFDCTDLGVQTIDVTVTDFSENSTTVTVDVTVEDNIKPNATPKDVTLALDANGEISITVDSVLSAYSDNCGISSVDLSQSTFDCANVGSTIDVTVTLTDASGNDSATVSKVTIVDGMAPTATTKDITIELDATGNATITVDSVLDTYGDNCSTITPVLSKTSFDCSDIALSPIVDTITLTDDYGNETEVYSNVTVVDKLGPVVNTLETLTIVLDKSNKDTVFISDVLLSANDICSELKDTTISANAIIDGGGNRVIDVEVSVTDIYDNVTTNTVAVTIIDSISDVEGNKYDVVKIGDQVWMAENLRATSFSDGTPITKVETEATWASHTSTVQAYCYYDNDSASNAEPYGVLYSWAAAMKGAGSTTAEPSGIQGVCPTGWHLPSDAEWEALAEYIDVDQGGLTYGGDGDDWTDMAVYLKSTTDWTLYADDNGNDTYGFNGVPSGNRNAPDAIGDFFLLNGSALYWSATESNSTNIYVRQLLTTSFLRQEYLKTRGISVRCVMD